MKFLQPSLSRGELAPGLHGRVDIAAYQVALGKCRNFITRPTGGAVKRPGFIFRGDVGSASRIFPFVYSTEIKYLIEAGNLYFRFWVGGARLTETPKAITAITQANPAVVTSNAHGYSNGDVVEIRDVKGMDRLNGGVFTIANKTANTFQLAGVNSSTYAAYVSGGTVAKVVQVTTPYTTAQLQDVRLTQSADVLYLVHPAHAPRELRRTTATTFELRNFDFRLGPFGPLNGRDAITMAVSATTGNVTVTCNANVFAAGMVGGLLYVEEKELRSVKPWEPLERNVAIGVLRRSDGKVYRATAVAPAASGGTPYNITGNTRPLHEVGRAWDGPCDARNDGVNGYSVGVEWEFVHGGFGIVKLTGYTSPTTATGTVIKRIPESIVGTAPPPVAGPWTFSGDGATKTFTPLTGATSPTQADYAVTIDGSPVVQDPYAEPTTGGSGPKGGSNTGPRLGDPPIYEL